MSLKKIMANKEKLYSITSITSNIIIVVAVIFLLVYLVAPLFGGKLLINAIIKYASWIGIALALKIGLKRAKRGLRIRGYEYSLICLLSLIWLYGFHILLTSSSAS